MDFKEYCKTEQEVAINESFGTALRNLNPFNRTSVAIDVGSYPNQFILPPSAYVRIMDLLQGELVTYWEAVNGAKPKARAKKAPYYSYQLKDVNTKTSKIKNAKFPIWNDVKNINTGTSFYLQSMKMWDTSLNPFGKNSTFETLAKTLRGGDICVLDIGLDKSKELAQDLYWYPTIPGQEAKFADVEKEENQFILLCTNTGLKYIIALLGFPIPTYIKIESLKQLGYEKANVDMFKTVSGYMKRITGLMGDAMKKAKENPEGTEAKPEDKTTSTSAAPEAKPEDKTTSTSAAPVKKLESSGKAPIDKTLYTSLLAKGFLKENKKIIYTADKYLKKISMINEAYYGIDQFDDDDSIKITALPNKPIGKIFTDMGYKVFRQEDGEDVTYTISTGADSNTQGIVTFFGGATPHIAVDKMGKEVLKKALEGGDKSPWVSVGVASTPAEAEKTPEDKTAETPEEPKTDEVKPEEPKTDEVKPEEPKTPEDKVEPAKTEEPTPAEAEKTPAEEPKTDEKPDAFTEAIGEFNSDKVNTIKSKYSNGDYSEIGTIPKEAIDKFIKTLTSKRLFNVEESLDLNAGNPWTAQMFNNFKVRQFIAKNVGYVIISCMDKDIVKICNSKTPQKLKEFINTHKESFGVTIITKNDAGEYVILANENGKEFLKLNNKVFNIEGAEVPSAEPTVEPESTETPPVVKTKTKGKSISKNTTSKKTTK